MHRAHIGSFIIGLNYLATLCVKLQRKVHHRTSFSSPGAGEGGSPPQNQPHSSAASLGEVQHTVSHGLDEGGDWTVPYTSSLSELLAACEGSSQNSSNTLREHLTGR